MSLSTNQLADAFRKAAVDANEAGKPFSMTFGTVLTPEPNIRIQVNQKLILDNQQLLLTDNVRDFKTMITTSGESEEGAEGDTHYTSTEEQIDGSPNPGQFSPHRHEYKGKKRIVIHRKLKVGEKVILLRADGGQQYIVLSRVEAT